MMQILKLKLMVADRITQVFVLITVCKEYVHLLILTISVENLQGLGKNNSCLLVGSSSINGNLFRLKNEGLAC